MGELDSSTPRVSGDLLTVSILSGHIVETIETSPDKKMRVGSLQSPREYDGRLPLDVDSSLDLVIPL